MSAVTYAPVDEVLAACREYIAAVEAAQLSHSAIGGLSRVLGAEKRLAEVAAPFMAPAQPAAREPLGEAEIIRTWGLRSDGPENREIIGFARAIERAHGITAPSKDTPHD